MKFVVLAVTTVLGCALGTSHAATVIPLVDLGGRAGFHINGQADGDLLGLPVSGLARLRRFDLISSDFRLSAAGK